MIHHDIKLQHDIEETYNNGFETELNEPALERSSTPRMMFYPTLSIPVLCGILCILILLPIFMSMVIYTMMYSNDISTRSTILIVMVCLTFLSAFNSSRYFWLKDKATTYICLRIRRSYVVKPNVEAPALAWMFVAIYDVMALHVGICVYLWTWWWVFGLLAYLMIYWLSQKCFDSEPCRNEMQDNSGPEKLSMEYIQISENP
jgi:hypothetical protein